MEFLKNIVQKLLRKGGADIIRYPWRNLVRRRQALKHFNITTVFDIGANAGQFALEIRRLGYKGKILSFEPTSSAFNKLQKAAKKDNNWELYNMAIGSYNGEVEINLSQNSYSSSILAIEKMHLDAAPEAQYIGKEKVSLLTLESFLSNKHIAGNLYLKIDTQGYEKEVLKGAEKILDRFSSVQLEISLVELYKGEMLWDDTCKYLKSHGFEIYTIEPEFYNNETGQLLQVDAIFYKR